MLGPIGPVIAEHRLAVTSVGTVRVLDLFWALNMKLRLLASGSNSKFITATNKLAILHIDASAGPCYTNDLLTHRETQE